jgi:hypothetical protein
MYVDALLRLHARERRQVRRISSNGAEVTLIHVAESSDDEEERLLNEPLFLRE